MSHSHTGNWSVVALISCRQMTSGCSRSMNSCTCAWRARIPFTFQVATLMRIRRLYVAPGTQLASAYVDGQPPRASSAVGGEGRGGQDVRALVASEGPG